ncbi:PstS family phosphate ABC transporter substrate-binding protein [Cyanobium sp. ATX 6A2]|uniref:PstS family phosphate ABC transporter substrate-binding protein n=1 Tax=Cyanobium sp. ATX 6A2 TaxID=2823700 RepID=UPI0020CDBE94|nr:PstS family phosphate ABC transporter substrate-binding protein [Cyanobium sp. ATX 6A2]MCP9888479.1 PstS family phosphate ABC transporter substrate-binding protein [Cyanobium sp. ATX 6A2]
MARHRQCSALLLTASLALLSGCGDRVADSTDSGGSASLTISGSSTVFPVIEKAIEGFAKTERGRDVRVKLSEVGTTGGMREFCQGAIPIANASRPISSAELKACADKGITFIELPLAFDALTVVVNGNNDWASAITTKELSRTWSKEAEGKIKNWQQINIDWPDRPLRLCGPGTDSGTFDYFNEAINGDKANSRSDFEGSEDDNVIVECVGSDPNAMGYFGFAYYQANQDRLNALAIAGADGIAVAPSVESAQDGSYKPLSRPLFMYVNDKQMREDDTIRSFVGFTVGNGLRFVEEAGYIPLPADTYRLVETKLYRHILGTSFGGDLPIGLTIGEALRKSFDETRKEGYR